MADKACAMNTKTLKYSEVMAEAVRTRVTLAPAERMRWSHIRDGFYGSACAHHVLEPVEGGYDVILREGKVLITGAPTVDAAKAAADVALKMER
jgi:hypothetical protein